MKKAQGFQKAGPGSGNKTCPQNEDVFPKRTVEILAALAKGRQRLSRGRGQKGPSDLTDVNPKDNETRTKIARFSPGCLMRAFHVEQWRFHHGQHKTGPA